MRTSVVRRARVAAALITASVVLSLSAASVAADDGLEITTPSGVRRNCGQRERREPKKRRCPPQNRRGSDRRRQGSLGNGIREPAELLHPPAISAYGDSHEGGSADRVIDAGEHFAKQHRSCRIENVLPGFLGRAHESRDISWRRRRALPTPAVLTCQEDGVVGIEAAPVAVMPRLELGKCRGDEGAAVPELIETEVLIIGCGVAGGTVALRLADAGMPVTAGRPGRGRSADTGSGGRRCRDRRASRSRRPSCRPGSGRR